MKNKNIYDTAKLSLVIQFLTGLIGIQGLFLDIPEKHHILKDILTLETIVQFIEFVYYIWLLYCFKQLTYDITFTRYFDWFLSTPIMIVSTILFLEYNTKIDQSNDKQTEILYVSGILQNNGSVIGMILFANFLMLFFGFLGERNIISRFMGFILGTLAFAYSFYLVYERFVGLNETNQNLFWFMFVVWSLYGIAYLFPYEIKNISYNLLDILSKNFYGVFLFSQILRLSTSS